MAAIKCSLAGALIGGILGCLLVARANATDFTSPLLESMGQNATHIAEQVIGGVISAVATTTGSAYEAFCNIPL